MKKYNDKVRVISEFDNDGNLAYNPKLENTTNVGNFVLCWENKVRISRYSEDEIRIDAFGTEILNKIHKKLLEHKIRVVEFDRLNGEGSIIFKEEKMPTVFKICKARRQCETPVSVINVKKNVKLYDKTYKAMLLKRKDEEGNEAISPDKWVI